ncbi:Uncharacterised protein [Mycobacteroides abscessus subsp. abscessus]|uniref:Uncharacterized protein n=1 Tax=Mycobacteroides abscessus subsp. abscessus TaxID=1185650 RepID=A0AB38D0J7_9MYCO|nr:hypothetical protein [Mycobacteroides abscessus]SHX05560.1 Uncharacterised protein [Mycobacteroides abscessus subsp. abscessus]SIA13148.1 Uncharacterised protein [Mycobacteroides abscessus subsp. abscessus]SIB13556.1 Uncharacterised protein [Mycobacteroides abscessus subsp. abscessus]SIB15314.1 Uncharacterised protein [Mycobacteroides abscessus subsp. abscessus]SIB19272.1 Uncharacterised protein [Mycobacteroides abscessus subsp. abscessus]
MTEFLKSGIAPKPVVDAVNDLISRVANLEDFNYAVEEKPAPKKAPAKKVAPAAE